MASSMQIKRSDKDGDIWLRSWFGQLNHLVEYTCIHSALLPVTNFGYSFNREGVILDDLWIKSPQDTIARLKAEPFGVCSNDILADEGWKAHIASLDPRHDGNKCHVSAIVDAQGMCCLRIAGSSLFWLIHPSKLNLYAPKSKRRGLSDATRRPESLVSITTLASTIAKKSCQLIPAMALIPDSDFLEACLKCWIHLRLMRFASKMIQSLSKHAVALEKHFATKLGGQSELHVWRASLLETIQKSVVPIDPTWFTCRFDIFGHLMSIKIPLAMTQSIAKYFYLVCSLT